MNPIDLYGATFAGGSAAIAAGSTTTMTAGTVIAYCINGKAAIQGATSAVQPAATDANTGVALAGIPAGYGAVVVFGYSVPTSTTMQMVQSEIVPLNPNSAAYTPGTFVTLPEWPAIPDTFCPVGYATVKVATDYTAGAKYVFGTSNTTATGAQGAAATAHANLFTSIMVLPDRPQGP